jgi:TPR repeat protein
MKTLRNFTIYTLAAVMLCACNVIPLKNNPIAQLTLADAQNASSMAAAANDTKAKICYDYIAAQITSDSAGGLCGVLCINELKRSSVTASSNLGQACGGVIPLVVAP